MAMTSEGAPWNESGHELCDGDAQRGGQAAGDEGCHVCGARGGRARAWAGPRPAARAVRAGCPWPVSKQTSVTMARRAVAAYSGVMTHRTTAELEQGLGDVMASPRDEGPVRLIVRRPGRGRREVLAAGELDQEVGLVGDDWIDRPSRATGRPSPYAQLTVMNARFAALITGDAGPDAWAQAGDQLYVDLDLSQENLPAGLPAGRGQRHHRDLCRSRIRAAPSSSPASDSDAMRLANSERGRDLRLRGANAVVVRSGVVHTGDVARKVSAAI